MKKTSRVLSLLLVALMLLSTVAILGSCKKDPVKDPDGDKTENKAYTLNDYSGASPVSWNVHNWQTNGDQVILAYAEMGLVDVRMKSEGEYEWVYEMATAIDDITGNATAEEKTKWGIADGEEGRMWRIKLNPNAKWADGTVINADTYVYSMQQMLDSKLKNSRADLYWNGESAVYNGDIWFNQDKVGEVVYKNIPGTAAEALAAGLDVYVDMWNFYGLNAEGCNDDKGNACPQYVSINNETKYRDVSVAEGEDGDWISAKELYEGYFAAGAPYEGYGSTYLAYTFEIPKIEWSDVGLYKTGDYEIVYVTRAPQTKYYFLVSSTSNWIVYKDLYEKGKKTEGELTTTDYGTSLETYMSYGPYKLASFEKDKQFTFVKNDNWYGYTDDNHKGEFQATQIVVDILTDHSTALQRFLKGDLDSIEMTADDLKEYGASEYLLKTPESYTMKFSFNSNLDVLKALEKERNNGKNLQILSVYEFRKAMSWSFDRNKFCTEATAGYIPQTSLLSTLYVYDVENDPKSIYRNSTQAMQGIVNYYGIEYGAGKTYETLEEAYRACTGYDLEEAKKLFQQAYDKAVAAGLYTDGQEIEMQVGASGGSVTDEYTKQEKMVNEFLAAATKGTSLEGKVTVKYFYNLENRYGDTADGKREICYGALGGATFYPFRCFNSYIDASQAVGGKITEGNFKPDALKIKISCDFNGDGKVEEIEDTVTNWNSSIQADGRYYTASNDIKLTILSAIEVKILEECETFPVAVTSSVTMYSKKINYITTEYNYMYGYGGVRQMKFNYSDEEWNKYVADQGGTLNYK